MTSNTSPNGECFGTTSYQNLERLNLYLAFDQNDNTEYAYEGIGPAEIGYKFDIPVEIQRFEIKQRVGGVEGFCDITLYYSDDGVNYTKTSDTYDNLPINSSLQQFNCYDNLGLHKYWKVITTRSTTNNGGLAYLQFYGHGLKFN